MTDVNRLLADSRRDEWRKCVEDHASEDWGTTCDACLYLPEVYAQLEAVEARLPDYEAAVEALERVLDQFDYWTGEPRPAIDGGKVRLHDFWEVQPPMERCLVDARAALARLRDEVPA